MKVKDFSYFYPEKPTLIHIEQPLIDILDGDKNQVAERKYNGKRCVLHYIANEFLFYDRHGNRMPYTPSPELEKALRSLPLRGYCLFDGELRDKKVIGIRDKLIIYDVFIWEDELLLGIPFRERRHILEKILTVNGDPLGITEQFPDHFRDLFQSVIDDPEIEGLVIKNLNGVLELGRRAGVPSKWMTKVRKPSGRYHF